MKLQSIFSNRNIFIVATLVFVVWVVFFDRNNYIASRELDERIAELEEERDYFIQKIREDSIVIVGLKDSAFLERYARENFLMRKAGEEIYIIGEKEE